MALCNPGRILLMFTSLLFPILFHFILTIANGNRFSMSPSHHHNQKLEDHPKIKTPNLLIISQLGVFFAERTRFELVVGLLLRQFSKLVVSATHPPLLGCCGVALATAKLILFYFPTKFFGRFFHFIFLLSDFYPIFAYQLYPST